MLNGFDVLTFLDVDLPEFMGRASAGESQMGRKFPQGVLGDHAIGDFITLSRLGGGDRSGPVDIAVALEEGMSFGGHGSMV